MSSGQAENNNFGIQMSILIEEEVTDENGRFDKSRKKKGGKNRKSLKKN